MVRAFIFLLFRWLLSLFSAFLGILHVFSVHVLPPLFIFPNPSARFGSTYTISPNPGLSDLLSLPALTQANIQNFLGFPRTDSTGWLLGPISLTLQSLLQIEHRGRSWSELEAFHLAPTAGVRTEACFRKTHQNQPILLLHLLPQGCGEYAGARWLRITIAF